VLRRAKARAELLELEVVAPRPALARAACEAAHAARADADDDGRALHRLDPHRLDAAHLPPQRVRASLGAWGQNGLGKRGRARLVEHAIPLLIAFLLVVVQIRRPGVKVAVTQLEGHLIER